MKFEKIAVSYAHNITCPWCGWEYNNSWEMGEENNLEECENCGRYFAYQREVEVTYNSTRAEYGTCISCGEKEIPLITEISSLGKIEDVCEDCYSKKRHKLFKEYMEDITLKGEK